MSQPARARRQSTAVAKIKEQPVAAPPMGEAAAIIHVIERAALNPDVDVEKMERLYAMHEKAMERQACAAFSSALAEAQPKLPVIDRNGRIEVPDKPGKTGHVTPYATWEDINDAIRPVLQEYGFALSFRIGQADDGKITVTGVLSHRDGHREETTITLMHDSTGSKNSVQAVGSSVAYGKRYTAMALLNITSRAKQDRDDDGHGSGAPAGPETITDQQIRDLSKLINDVGADRDRFLSFLRINALGELPRSRFEAARQALLAKRTKR